MRQNAMKQSAAKQSAVKQRFFWLGLLLVSSTAMAGQLYQYMDDQGHRIIEQQISPQAIKHGYKILDDHGNVVGSVKPARELQQQQQKKLEKAAVEAAAQKTAAPPKEETKVEFQPLVVSPSVPTPVVNAVSDDKLLELFKTPDDAVRVRDRKLKDLDTALAFTQGRLKALQAEQKAKIAEAAELEFNGKPVPAEYTKDFSERVNQIQQTQADLLSKQNEQKNLKLEYDRTIARLHELMGANKPRQETPVAAGS